MIIYVFSKNSPTGISGGRIHGFLIVEALAALGHDVYYITNARPAFYDFYIDYPNHKKINLIISSELEPYSNLPSPDFVFIIPNRGSQWKQYKPYLNAIYSSFKNNAPVYMINFETPNWFNQVSTSYRPEFEWCDQVRVSKLINGVISSSNESLNYAKKFYSKYNKSLTHCCIEPPINSICADKAPSLPKKRQIIFFPRWNDEHKNSNGILNFVREELRDCTFVIVVGAGYIPPYLIEKLKQCAKTFDIKIQLHQGISDSKKYSLIKESKVLAFMSSFEGFGLLPVEAQYCGTKAVVFDLPVLREVSKDNIVYVEPDNYEKFTEQLAEILNNDYDPETIKSKITWVATFDSFVNRINTFLQTLPKNQANQTLKRIKYSFDKMIYQIKSFYYLKPSNKVKVIHKDTHEVFKQLLISHVQKQWQLLKVNSINNVVIFGAGAHTSWLESILYGVSGPEIISIIDDNADDSKRIWSLTPQKPEEVNKPFDAVILSTDTHQKIFTKRSKEIFGKDVKTINFYEDLGEGPFPK